MVKSLRYEVHKNFGNIHYLHYFRRMIKDYENRKWDFDIRKVVKNIKVDIPCPKYLCKRGFMKRLCWTIINEQIFLKEFDRYLNGYVRPIQELRRQKILSRKVFLQKYGYITKYNKDCAAALYDCKKCKSKSECDIARKFNKNDFHIFKITRMFEILYSNITYGYWADLVDKKDNDEFDE